MLCTFTTRGGKALIIRSEDIRVLEDQDDGAYLLWAITDDMLRDRVIVGTAAENRDRIQQEELGLIARVEAHRYETQRRLAEGYPVPPVKRGK